MPNIALSGLNGVNGFRLDGFLADDNTAASVAWAGDVNDDSYADFIIGAPGADLGGAEAGGTHLIFGHASGFASAFDLIGVNRLNGVRVDGAAGGDESGVSVATAGDLNGDFFDDFIVGAFRAGPNGVDSGASFVLFGRPRASFPPALTCITVFSRRVSLSTPRARASMRCAISRT